MDNWTSGVVSFFEIIIDIPNGSNALDDSVSDYIRNIINGDKRYLIRSTGLGFALSHSGCSTNWLMKPPAHLFGSVTVMSLNVLFPGFESGFNVIHSLLISVLMLQNFRWSSQFFACASVPTC